MADNNQVNNEQVVTKLKEYITDAFLYDREEVSLTADFQLVKQGVVDSMGIFRLITFLEEEFGVTVEPDEVVISNFETIDAITALVIRAL